MLAGYQIPTREGNFESKKGCTQYMPRQSNSPGVSTGMMSVSIGCTRLG